MRLVAKIGTSSITDALGVIDEKVVDNICDQLAALRASGHEVILVSSGAVSAGVAALGMSARPTDMPTLQAISAAGQSRLMGTSLLLFKQLPMGLGRIAYVPCGPVVDWDRPDLVDGILNATVKQARRHGAMASGTARWRRLRLASPSAPMPASSIRSGCWLRCSSTSSPTSRRPPRITA